MPRGPAASYAPCTLTPGAEGTDDWLSAYSFLQRAHSKIQFTLRNATSTRTPGRRGIYTYGPDLYDPAWFTCMQAVEGGLIRFTGVVGSDGTWMDVSCDDTRWTFMLSTRMTWQARSDGGGLRLGGEGQLRCTAELNASITMIRQYIYWTLRTIVWFKRLLFRIRMRHVKRKLFIRSTYWGHPECKFSRFSGTINTPVKQRIYAYI